MSKEKVLNHQLSSNSPTKTKLKKLQFQLKILLFKRFSNDFQVNLSALAFMS